MMDFFRGLYRQLRAAVGRKRLQKEYGELINILRTTVPLGIPELEKIEKIMGGLVQDRAALAARFRLLRMALRQRKELGAGVKARYSMFIANEHDRLAKRKVDKDRDVSYGVNGNIVYGDVDSDEERTYFTGDNVKALNSLPLCKKQCAFDCGPTQCRSCIEARLRREITQKVQLEEEMRREELAKKRRLGNDGKVVTALNERLGCPLLIARSLADDAFTLDELDSEDREEFLKWKDNNRQLAKQMNKEMFRGVAEDAHGSMFIDGAEARKDRGKIITNGSFLKPINDDHETRKTKDGAAPSSLFSSKAPMNPFRNDASAPVGMEGPVGVVLTNPFAFMGGPSKQAPVPEEKEALEEPPNVTEDTSKPAGFASRGEGDNYRQLPFDSTPAPRPADEVAHPTGALSTGLRNPFASAKKTDAQEALEQRKAERGITPMPTPTRPLVFPVGAKDERTPPAEKTNIFDKVHEKPVSASSPELLAPKAENTDGGNFPRAALPKVSKFSFDNPFQSGTITKPSSATARTDSGMRLPPLSAYQPVFAGASQDLSKESTDMFRDLQTQEKPLEINATATSPLSSIIAGSPFEQHTKQSKDVLSGGPGADALGTPPVGKSGLFNLGPGIGGTTFPQSADSKGTSLNTSEPVGFPTSPSAAAGNPILSNNLPNPFASMDPYAQGLKTGAADEHRPFLPLQASAISNPFAPNNPTLATPFVPGMAATAPFSQMNMPSGSSAPGQGMTNPFAAPAQPTLSAETQNPFSNLSFSSASNPFQKRPSTEDESAVPNVFGNEGDSGEVRNRRARRKRD